MSERGRPAATEEAFWELRQALRRLLIVVAVELGIPRLLRSMAGAIEWVCDRRSRKER